MRDLSNSFKENECCGNERVEDWKWEGRSRLSGKNGTHARLRQGEIDITDCANVVASFKPEI